MVLTTRSRSSKTNKASSDGDLNLTLLSKPQTEASHAPVWRDDERFVREPIREAGRHNGTLSVALAKMGFIPPPARNGALQCASPN
jgi:hypothetical protein